MQQLNQLLNLCNITYQQLYQISGYFIEKNSLNFQSCTSPCSENGSKNCHQFCSTCYGPNSNQCCICKQPYYFDPLSKTCYSTCPTGYFLQDNSICTISCPNNQFGDVISGKCVFECPINYFGDVSKWLCVNKCENSFENTITKRCDICENKCTSTCSCNLNQYYQSIDSTCQPCHQYCTSCIGPNSNQCCQCISTLFYYAEKTACVINCPSPLFGQTLSMTCARECQDNTWAHPISRYIIEQSKKRRCLTVCPDPLWGDMKTKSCVEACPDNTFESVLERRCQLCNSKCYTCKDSKEGDCIKCAEGQFMNSKNLCTQCDPQLYSNSIYRTCEPYLTYTYQLINNEDTKITFQIEFNNSIKEDTFNSKAQITVSQLHEGSDQDYTIGLNNITPLMTYVIQIKFHNSHRDTFITLDFSTLQDIHGTPVQESSKSFQIPIPAQYLQTQKEQQVIDLNRIMTIVFLSFFASIFCLCKLIKTQIRIFYILVYHLQLINLLLLQNFEFPNCVVEALLLLNICNLRYIPVVGFRKSPDLQGDKIYYFDHEVINQLPQNNLYLQAKYYYSFFVNGGMQLFIYLIILWTAQIISSIFHTLYQKQSKLDKIQIFRAIYELLNDLVIRVHELLYFPFLTLFFLQMQGANFDDGFNIASFIIAIFFFIYYAYYLYNNYEAIKDQEQIGDKKEVDEENQNILNQKYGQLFQDFDLNDRFKKNFMFFQYGVKIVTTSCLVLINDYKYIQFSIVAGAQFCYLLILIRIKPYKRPFFTNIKIIGQIFFLSLYFILLGCQIKYNDFADVATISQSSQEEFFNVGYAFIIIFQIMLSLYAFFLIINKISDYRSFVALNPKWGVSFLEKMENFFFSGKNSTFDQNQLENEKETTSLHFRDKSQPNAQEIELEQK